MRAPRRQKLDLQLKTGGSCLRERLGEGSELFRIREPGHAWYCQQHAFHVLLVIRNPEGEVRWMEARDWLKSAIPRTNTCLNTLSSRRLAVDVMSGRGWRHRALTSG